MVRFSDQDCLKFFGKSRKDGSDLSDVLGNVDDVTLKFSDSNVSFLNGDHGHDWVDSGDQEFFEERKVLKLVRYFARNHLVFFGEWVEISRFSIR